MNRPDDYIDEDRALGFNVWVAELELLVGMAKGRSVDQVAAFELLQKVWVTITPAHVDRIKEYQRRAETCLLDLLLKGAASPVRRLIGLCLAALYEIGDSLPMYARVGDLRSLLAAKEARSMSDATKIGLLQCLAVLCWKHGQRLATSLGETLSVALKYTHRGLDLGIRLAACECIARVVSGLGASDRSSLTIQTDAYKCAIKLAKETGDIASVRVQLAATKIIRSICKAEGLPFWSSTSFFDETLRLCLSHLDIEDQTLADAYASILGELAFAATSDAGADAVKALEKKARQKAALEQLLASAFSTCLVVPFVTAANQKKPRTCLVLQAAWIAYAESIQLLQGSNQGNDRDLIEVAVKALEMLSKTESGQLSSEDTELGSFLSSGELPHPQACILYILRAGIIEHLGETGQRVLLERLTTLLASQLGSHVAVAVTSLGALGLLMEILGEIEAEEMERVENAVGDKLIQTSSPLRRQAASVLASIATAEPSSASRLLQERLNGLSNSVNRMALVCGQEPTDLPQGPQLFGDKIAVSRTAVTQESLEGHLSGTPRGMVAKEAGVLKPAMDVVHGNALGIAALLVAAARLPLGIPSKLHSEAFKLCSQLIEEPISKRAAGRAVEREAGYTILGALFLALPPDMLEEKELELSQLLQTALAPESVAELDLRKYLTVSLATAEVTMSTELWWRAAALEAVKAVLLANLAADAKKLVRLQRRIALMLQPAITLILSSPVLQDPQRTKGVLGGASAYFQFRLLEAYLAIPDPNIFSTEHQNLSKLCMRAFRASSILTSAQQGVASSAATSALRQLLNKSDSNLGPWRVGKAPLEDSLQSFNGAPGGPMYHPWEGGLPFSLGYSGSGVRVSSNPFPQPSSLSAALLERQLELLGSLLAVVEEPNQVQILDVMLAASNGPPSKPGLKESPLWRRAILITICSTALAGLDSLARRFRGISEDRDAVAARAKALAEAALKEGAATVDVALLRSAAEMYALAACIGSDANAIQLLASLCTELASTPVTARRITYALALGCIYRSKGGMALQATIAQVSRTLLAVAEVSSGTTSLWLTHALTLVANAAGLSFIPHVKGVLQFVMKIAMSNEPDNVAGLRPAIGQLANAVVTVLGPELRLGSAAYNTTRALINDLQHSQGSASAEKEATMLELERVLYVQMLILFAPHAVPAVAHLPLLLATLNSRQPTLRKTAADTLRHLAERDPQPILPSKIESQLFSALDKETDVSIAAQLRGTISTLLAACASDRPSHYLSVCSAVILAATNTAIVEPVSEIMDDAALEDDDEAGIEERRESGRTASTSQPSFREHVPLTSRIRTRVYAADCLLHLPPLVANDPRHFDLAAAQASQAGDLLVRHLQELIELSFKMATGNVEAIRPAGLKMLMEILRYFGNVQDPLLEGARLLEQFQAQYVTALRAALSPKASPSLVSAGASLSADFMKSGLAISDRALLSKLIGMMTGPLAPESLQQQELYAEWVGIGAKIALLEANAICLVYLLTNKADSLENVRELMGTTSPRYLVQLWIHLIQEWVVLTTQPTAVLASYAPKLFTVPGPAIYPSIRPHLTRAWSPSLAAAALVISQLPEEPEEEENISTDDYKLILGACYLALVSNSAPEVELSLSEADLSVVLNSLTHLLGPAFLLHFDVMLLKDIVNALFVLVKQKKLFQGAVREAAAKCVLQICFSSPSGYLFSIDLVQSLLSTLLAFLEPNQPETEQGFNAFPTTDTCMATVLQAGTILASKAQGPLAMAVLVKLALQGMACVESDSEGQVVASACTLLLEVARAASAKFDSSGNHPLESNGQSVHCSLLVHIAKWTCDTLSKASQAGGTAEGSTMSRQATLLNLLLALGPLLAAEPIVPRLPELQILKPSDLESPSLQATSDRAAAAADVTPASDEVAADETPDENSSLAPILPPKAESVESDDWGTEGEDDWADAGFEEASQEAAGVGEPEQAAAGVEQASQKAAGVEEPGQEAAGVEEPGQEAALEEAAIEFQHTANAEEQASGSERSTSGGDPVLASGTSPRPSDGVSTHGQHSSRELTTQLHQANGWSDHTAHAELLETSLVEPASELSAKASTPAHEADHAPTSAASNFKAAFPEAKDILVENEAALSAVGHPRSASAPEHPPAQRAELHGESQTGSQPLEMPSTARPRQGPQATSDPALRVVQEPALVAAKTSTSAHEGDQQSSMDEADKQNASVQPHSPLGVSASQPFQSSKTGPPSTQEETQAVASKVDPEVTVSKNPVHAEQSPQQEIEPSREAPIDELPDLKREMSQQPIVIQPAEVADEAESQDAIPDGRREGSAAVLGSQEAEQTEDEGPQSPEISLKHQAEVILEGLQAVSEDQSALPVVPQTQLPAAIKTAGGDPQALEGTSPPCSNKPAQPVSEPTRTGSPATVIQAGELPPLIAPVHSKLSGPSAFQTAAQSQPDKANGASEATATKREDGTAAKSGEDTAGEAPWKKSPGVLGLLAKFENAAATQDSIPQKSFRHVLRPAARQGQDPPWVRREQERSPEQPVQGSSDTGLLPSDRRDSGASSSSASFQAARNLFAERSNSNNLAVRRNSLRRSRDLDDSPNVSKHLNLRGGGDGSETDDTHDDSLSGANVGDDEDDDDWGGDEFVAAAPTVPTPRSSIDEESEAQQGRHKEPPDPQPPTPSSNPELHSDHNSHAKHAIPEELSTARQAILQALEKYFCDSDAAAQSKVLDLLQKAVMDREAGACASSWALSCCTLVIPKAVESLLPCLQAGTPTEEQCLIAGQLVKLIVATLSLAQKESADLSRQLLRCMAELMVLFARSGNHQASQGLRELSRKLMTLLAGGEFAAEFKSTLLSLPPQARQALQAILQSNQHTAAARVSQAQPSVKAPSIALKTFAALKIPAANTTRKNPSPAPSLSDIESDEQDC